jgi:REP-associated tyrosine transposase
MTSERGRPARIVVGTDADICRTSMPAPSSRRSHSGWQTVCLVRSTNGPRQSRRTKRERFFIFEKAIDQGRGNCLLTDHANAAIVRETLEHSDGVQYLLLAWAIMPNHVHVMIEQIDGHCLTNAVQSWKSVSAHAINKIRGTNGRIWSPDYFDRFVRNEDHYVRTKYYIENNPVKAHLVGSPEDWLYSSAAGKA